MVSERMVAVVSFFLVGCGASVGNTSSAAGTESDFSFFVTSLAALRELSGSSDGFGGDLRFGETGAGAGLRGADKLCATIAERSLAGAGSKPWRAFLSASSDGTGAQVNAIDRVGTGPWYDRVGRLVASTKSDLLAQRPASADTAIIKDLPNEDGVPNHAPDGLQVDNHDMLTGTDTSGKLASGGTCADWTSTTVSERPVAGHAFPRAGGTNNDSAHWMSAHPVPGCKAGITITEGNGMGSSTVGGAGGYGGFYCFVKTGD